MLFQLKKKNTLQNGQKSAILSPSKKISDWNLFKCFIFNIFISYIKDWKGLYNKFALGPAAAKGILAYSTTYPSINYPHQSRNTTKNTSPINTHQIALFRLQEISYPEIKNSLPLLSQVLNPFPPYPGGPHSENSDDNANAIPREKSSDGGNVHSEEGGEDRPRSIDPPFADEKLNGNFPSHSRTRGYDFLTCRRHVIRFIFIVGFFCGGFWSHFGCLFLILGDYLT